MLHVGGQRIPANPRVSNSFGWQLSARLAVRDPWEEFLMNTSKRRTGGRILVDQLIAQGVERLTSRDHGFDCVPHVVGTGLQHGPNRSAASKHSASGRVFTTGQMIP